MFCNDLLIAWLDFLAIFVPGNCWQWTSINHTFQLEFVTLVYFGCLFEFFDKCGRLLGQWQFKFGGGLAGNVCGYHSILNNGQYCVLNIIRELSNQRLTFPSCGLPKCSMLRSVAAWTSDELEKSTFRPGRSRFSGLPSLSHCNVGFGMPSARSLVSYSA